MKLSVLPGVLVASFEQAKLNIVRVPILSRLMKHQQIPIITQSIVPLTGLLPRCPRIFVLKLEHIWNMRSVLHKKQPAE